MAGFLNFNKNDASLEEREQTENNTLARILIVDINDIETSHVNPRNARGEHYESTKESIRNIGLQSILTVTKLPNTDRYSLYNGGNTRLTILKELVDEYMSLGQVETARKFQMQQVRFVPYTNDIDLLIKHIAENEERSGMTFIDKARAVYQIKQLYLSQSDDAEISNRKLTEYIHSLGWTRINNRVMTELQFAYDELEAVIPLSLESGMGRPKVMQLRQFISYVEILVSWFQEKRGGDLTPAQARAMYFDVMRDFDDDLAPMDIDSFLEAYRIKLAEHLTKVDTGFNPVRILNEVEYIAEHGKVYEEVPEEDLYRRLDATAFAPKPKFPTPRKPRTPSERTEDAEYSEKTAAQVPHAVDDDSEQSQMPISAQGIEPEKAPAMPAEPQRAILQFAPGIPLDYPSVQHIQIQLPSSDLPFSNFVHACIPQAHEILRQMIALDSRNLLSSILELDDDAPYFFINLHDDNKNALFDLFLHDSSSVVSRYLYCGLLGLIDSAIRIQNATVDGDPQAELSVTRIQAHFSEPDNRLFYLEHQIACRTGLLLFMYQQADAAALLAADTLMTRLQAVIYSVETRRLMAQLPQQEG